MSRIGTEFPFPNLSLGSFGISSINDESVKDLAEARHSAGKESIRLIKKKFCSGDNSEVPLLDIEIRQRTGHCMRRHVTSEREPCAFEKVMKLNS